MGPVSMDWYRARGLTLVETKVATEDSMLYNHSERYTTETITEHYSCGRIDVSPTESEPYGDEIGVPPMRSEDWRAFGRWLDDVETVSVWTLRDLVEAYEHETGKKIRWAKELR
jgi:hypothetical protein